MRTRLKSPDLYTIAWISALPIERAAATALLDERHDVPEGFHQHRSDANSYTWGRIGEHNIVIASLPTGVYGNTSTTNTAADLIHSLPHIRIGLLVGIGGGIARPDLGQDIRLGDIVVSQPDGTTGGVVQYDLGKAKANSVWERKGSLDKPPPVLLHALASLQAEHEIAPSKIPDLLQAMLKTNPHMRSQKNGYTYQGTENDRLFESHRDHVGGSTCDKCDSAWAVKRDQRESTNPVIHYGVIASGNKLIKDAATRDNLSEEIGHQCLCVEMEAAGLMDRFPCLVIRGICDYADSHKNDRWQRYAAAAASAFAVELLGFVPARQVEATQKVIEVMQSPAYGRKQTVEQKVNSLSVPIQNIDYRTALNQLQVAEGASFDSHAEEHNPTCLPNTRVELLEDVYRWVDDSKSKPIFWLNGMAGTGKSTISRTVAQMRHDRGDLGASFFFKRGETDRGNLAKFVPTLARQLAWSIPGVAPFIKKAIDVDSDIVHKTVREQFEKLIREPLCKVAATSSTPSLIVMVIDALDECEREADIRLLIHILSQTQILRPRLRVFLTSRPELPVRLGFSEVQGIYRDLVLHEMPVQIVEHDISAFLADEFRKIRDSFNLTVGDERKLPSDWPGQQTLQDLTQMAVPLFIFAATVCRFISDRRWNPKTRLRKVLGHGSKSHRSQLDQTYGPILRSQITEVPKADGEEIIRDFRAIVGSIITLASPLSVTALSRLLDVSPDVVDERLDALHSVLSIPLTRTLPVRLLHLSFRDYLITEEGEFQVDEKVAHRNLAINCLRIMCGGLRENICGLSFPGMRRSVVDTLQLEEGMSPELQYACMYWAHHQTKVDFEPNDSQEVYNFLTTHFLHWMEALSLMGRGGEGLDSIRSLVGWLENRGDSSLFNFLADAIRFLLAHFSIINEAPLQIYSSALVFTPKRSIVRKMFENRIPAWLSVWPQVKEDWDACLLVLEGHSNWVNSVVFSRDSTMLASASYDNTVRIWDMKTGKCERMLEGHRGSVKSIVFSHDSTIVASASADNTVRIWGVKTEKCEHVLEGHGSWVNSVVFSHDSTMLASASYDNTVRIWNIKTGECKHLLEGHSDDINSVVFSHDSTMVASASDDNTVWIWDMKTGKCERMLEGHRGSVKSIVFSHDSTMMASASHDRTVRIWDMKTGKCERMLEGHRGSVKSIVFSHDSTMMASASHDRTVRVWHTKTGECKHLLEGHSGLLNLVVFSRDSTVVASASDDNTVRIWDMKTGKCEYVLEGHSGSVQSIVFSHDSTMVASASADRTVRVWGVKTEKCEHVLEGHSHVILSAVFSHDSTMVVSASRDNTVRIWDAKTGKCERVLKSPSSSARSAVFSHDSTRVASASWDDRVLIWDAKTGECKHVLEGHSGSVKSIVFSHNSTMVASASTDNTVRIWNIKTGECKHLLEGHSDDVNSVVFSHDSTMVASASRDNTVRIWDMKTGKCERMIEGHSGWVKSILFSHDSTMVASASRDKTVRIWNTKTGACREVISSCSSSTVILSFTPNESSVVTSNGVFAFTSDLVSSEGPPISSQPPVISALGLRDKTWVTSAGQDLFWLPTECRGGTVAISVDAVVIGCRSGRLIVLGFCR